MSRTAGLAVGLIFVASLGGVGCASPTWAPVTDSGRVGLLDGDASDGGERLSPVPKHAVASAGVFLPKGHKRHEGRHRPKLPSSTRLKKSSGRAYASIPKTLQKGVDGLMWPLHSVEVTSDYGKRGKVFHEGLDLKARVGTTVYSAQSGRVLYSGAKINGYGKMVVIRHPGGLATVYAHNSRLFVRRGDQVHRGQRIALSGKSGHAHGPHLHFETRRGVVALDPLKLLPIGENLGQGRSTLAAR